MSSDKKDKEGTVVQKQFKLDMSFDDPLKPVNLDLFEEIEVEEIPSYYHIHLGIESTNKSN